MKDFLGFLLILVVAIGIGNFKISLENKEQEEIAMAKEEKVRIELENKEVTKQKEEIDKFNKKEQEKKIKLEKKKDYGSFTYKNYKNKRFGFSIDYPSFLVKKEDGVEGDGITLYDKEERVKITVSGENNLEERKANTLLENDINIIEQKCYKKLTGNSYILSWEKEDRIYYKKSIVGRGSINILFVEYPKADKSQFHNIIDRLYRSFKPGMINEIK